MGTLYRHFPTREALAAAVYGDEVTAICKRARDSMLSAFHGIGSGDCCRLS
ncbi:hypothetical protein [Curtobacterium aetherium]|uniref:hypothetical protein n=1 Tax=Curtobacterium aetherium TaxID=2841594 RepID=UPI003B52F368